METKTSNIKEAILAHMNAEPGGSILVRNEGGYVARFTLSYQLNGAEFSKDSGDITLGISKSEFVPAEATQIRLKVEENAVVAWSTIFTKTYDVPTTECFKVWGTTLFPAHASIPC